jgi:hypothetical protein
MNTQENQVAKLTLEERQQRAEEILQSGSLIPLTVEWDGDRGIFECPSQDLHTTKSGRRDAIIYLDGKPRSWCFHRSCREWHRKATEALAAELDDRTPEEKKADKRNQKAFGRDNQDASYDELRVKGELTRIYRDFTWSPFPPSQGNDFHRFLSLWNDEDVIWVGETFDTGGINGIGHFREVSYWKSINLCPKHNHFTCASTFKPGSVDRIKDQVQTHKYFVVEFDQLAPEDKQENKRRGAAILLYLRNEMGFPLRMIVDSGNKSVHGWFDNVLSERNKLLLRRLGADMASMRPSQPVRRPGAIRENNNPQSILWMP